MVATAFLIKPEILVDSISIGHYHSCKAFVKAKRNKLYRDTLITVIFDELARAGNNASLAPLDTHGGSQVGQSAMAGAII
jgi:hypothetical protein